MAGSRQADTESGNMKPKSVKVVAAHAVKEQRERKRTAPFILNISAGRRWVVKLSPRPLYLRETTPVHIEQTLDGPPSASLEVSEERKIFCTCWIWTPDYLPHSPFSVPTTASRPPAKSVHATDLLLSGDLRTNNCRAGRVSAMALATDA
jgi:hypothetical protein